MAEVAPGTILDSQGQVVAIAPANIPQDPTKNKDRQTSRVMFYHEHFGEDTVVVELAESYFLETHGLEPLIKKRILVSEEWAFLPRGELQGDDVGDIVIQNNCGKNLSVQPTDEQLAEFQKQVFVIRAAGEKNGMEIHVPAGRFQKFHVNKRQLEIRCLHGEGRGYVWVFPR